MSPRLRMTPRSLHPAAEDAGTRRGEMRTAMMTRRDLESLATGDLKGSLRETKAACQIFCQNFYEVRLRSDWGVNVT